jgi:hypothetical protein
MYISIVRAVYMCKLEDTYYRYADTVDIYFNDIVLTNDNAHRFFRRLGVKLKPLELAYYVNILDPDNRGYITLNTINTVFGERDPKSEKHKKCG